MSIQSAGFSISNRGGDTVFGGSLTFGSAMQGMTPDTTTLGFGYSTGDSGRSIRLASTYTPPTMMEAVRLGAMGINPMMQTPALMMHGVASAAILQLTDRSRQMNIAPILAAMAWSAVSSEAILTAGTIALGGAVLLDKAIEGTREAVNAKGRQSAAAAGGMPPEDEEGKGDETQWNPQKNHDKKATHGAHGNFYRDPVTKEWWTKDTAGHSGQSMGKQPSAWKVYEETGRGLRWLRDTDINGIEIIGKHKGPVGQEISWKDLIMKK